jgi:hypothetical protein
LSISRASPPSQGRKAMDTNGNIPMPRGHGLDTRIWKNIFTDKRIGMGAVSLGCRFPTLLLLATLAVPGWAQSVAGDPGGGNESIRPLNLSIPAYALGSYTAGPPLAGTLDPQRDLADLPDLGSRARGPGPGQAGRLPYGSGYEARQRQQSSSEGGGFGGGQGNGNGAGSGMGGHGSGSGQGMGGRR